MGHTQYILDAPGLRDLNEVRAPDGSPLERGQICPLHPRTLEIAAKLLGDMAPFCTTGKVHVGLDESYHLGRHPLSRAEIAEVGKAGHFARHVSRLQGITGSLGLRLGLWADMLALLPEAIPLLPDGVIAYDWYYYPFRGRPRIELRNFAPCDLAAPLRARGIEHWGCPMNGPFRHEPIPLFGERMANIVAWWRRCRATGAGGMLVTSWEGGRIAAEAAMAVDAAAAGLWLDGEEDPARLLRSGARRMFGGSGARAARAMAAADLNPFNGYIRWRINDRWDGAPTDEPLAPWRSGARACGRLGAAEGLPPGLAASLRFRAYLAGRDLFVREAGRAVWRIRAALAAGAVPAARALLAAQERAAARFGRSVSSGRSAARAMWGRTRDRRVAGPNERIVAADAARLRAWRAWLRRRRDDGRAWEPSPVAGRCQLVFTVDNFEPLLQKVVVEVRGADGWTAVDGFFTVEFRACAARPRARVSHRVSVPLGFAMPAVPVPPMRIVARGYGRIRIRDVVLTDGVTCIALGRTAVIGERGPRRGYPDFDWEENRGKPLFLLEVERDLRAR
jgi:hypothetical protein